MSDGNSAYEMQTRSRPQDSRQRSASGSNGSAPPRAMASALRQDELDSSVKRSNSTGKRVGEGLKKRFGSLRRKIKTDS